MTDTDTTDAEPETNGQSELTASDGLSTRQEYQMRFALAQSLGDALPGDDDDYYEVFDWDKHPTVEDYYALALRNPYAFAVTFLPAKLSWRDPPDIVDHEEHDEEADGDDATAFEEAIADLEDDHRIWHYLKRADMLRGIGKFGIAVIQFDDIDGHGGLADPVSNPQEINGLRPFSRASVDEIRVGGPGTDRWGEPEAYKLDLSDENEEESALEREGPETVWVHWSRVLHLPSDTMLDDEIRGIPRQKPVYNNLVDVEKTLGAAGQLAYRAAAWGININIDKDFQLDDETSDQLHEHLQRWQHGLENVLRTHGADDVKSLGGEDIDPGLVVDPNIEAISAQTGIPQSVLKGNETGERATSEDLKEYYGKISGRRNEEVEPLLVRAFIDRLREFGVLPDPSGEGYDVEWVPLAEESEADVADIQSTRSETLQNLPDLEIELTPAEQAEWVEDGTLPKDLKERREQRVAELEEMGPLDDGVEPDGAEDELEEAGEMDQPAEEVPADD